MKKSKFINVLLVLILLVGLSLLLYPSLSDYYNSFHQTQAITDYSIQVSKLDAETHDRILQDAIEYNKELFENGIQNISESKYEKQLNVSGTGVMGYIEISKIRCSLPIYHGTEDEVLQTAIGHIEWSSLPVGGESTHCVLSGHRGLPSAKLFSKLDQLEVGDTFVLRVLDDVLTYEVDQILIVEPQEINSLQIEEGKDLCTLVTCTPYGVNTHRLLVRGHRIENLEDSMYARITADATQIDSMIVAPVLFIPLLLILIIVLLIPRKKGDK
ncbi:class C sortase [Floccifex sp.]|uniref:class C sortase n=1 Tax=Floccifex sp. TaxID=2815810 RepID=UPI003F0D71E5